MAICPDAAAAMVGEAWASNGDLALDALPLPDLGAEEDEGEGLEDPPIDELASHEADPDPFDDRPFDDLPLDVAIDLSDGEPSALDDEELGVGSDGETGVAIDDRDASLLDDRGHAEEGLDLAVDEELGIDPIPREADDGGLEGLEDPSADAVDDAFPPLDGAADDDEELDVGLHLPD